MSTDLIARIRSLVADGDMSRSGLARAAGLHANTLRDLDEPGWNPTAETLRKLETVLEGLPHGPVLSPIEAIIDDARNGKMFILVDDEDRENEGDLVIPAQMATPETINFMAKYGRGLICLSLTEERVTQLDLPLMSQHNGTRHQTAFTVSIEAREGVTTGISAADRARTVQVAIDPKASRADLVTPGHVFPLMAREGGVLVRAGHTEAAVDIARIAGLNPAGVICEIMNDDGSMARLPDLVSFAQRHGLKIGTIADLIAYRRRNDHLVERASESLFVSDYGGEWTAITYRNKVDGTINIALKKGRIASDQPTLVRMHAISIFSDLLGKPGERKRVLQRSMKAIGDVGAGVIVLLMATDNIELTNEIGSGGNQPRQMDLRSYGIGAQILADLGVQDMVLLTNSHRNIVALEGYGINIVGEQAMPPLESIEPRS
jgi:3,4-dihydroxy 2-butanone 4-phosphate synthase / GTP cyclohydrolase II